MGPKVPLRVPFKRVVVEGLKSGCTVALHADGQRIAQMDENAEYTFESPLAKGVVAQAELIGTGSCVSVRLEPK